MIKGSPNYKKFLTKQQFAAQFAPTAADSQMVANYLAANGQTVTHIDSHNLAVSATGSVANISFISTAPPTPYPNGEYGLGFYGGAGGGTSQGTAAPAWQTAFLGNSLRQQPDVALDADPFTGAEIIYIDYWDPGNITYVAVYGGTSLSCPIFSAVRALAEQKAGNPVLGNAAPLAYEESALFPGSFTDVKPVGSGHNAHGTIFYSGIPQNYSQRDLAGFQNSPIFYESLWDAQLITSLRY
jgi:subtilase family serine protease